MKKIGNTYLSFLNIINFSLHTHSEVFPFFNFSNLNHLAYQHNLWPTFYNTIRSNSSLLASSMLKPEEIIHYDNQLKSTIKSQLARIHEITKLVSAFEVKGVKAILLKGYALANLYPEPLLRISGDTDFLVHLDQVDLALNVLKEFGFEVLPKSKDSHHFVCDHPVAGRVELHIQLYDQHTATDWFKTKYLFEHITYTRNKTLIGECFVLEANDHLVYLTYHFIKHFLKKGVGIKQLTDLLLFMKANKHAINWDLYQLNLRQKGFHQLIGNLIFIGTTYLGFSESDFAYSMLKNTDILDRLVLDLLEAGTFGQLLKHRQNFSLLVDSQLRKRSRREFSTHFFEKLFPPAKQLKFNQRYVYLKKYPFLLPFAWVDRVFYQTFNVLFNRSSYVNTIFNRQDKHIKHRIKLMHDLGISVNQIKEQQSL